jgi:putative redox protein
MQASVVWSKGMSFTGTADSGHTVAIGTDPGVGGDDDGLRPMELMAISLAGCTAMDVISILRKKRVDVTGFEVKVDGDRAADHPKVFTAFNIHYVVRGHDVEPAAVERAMELSRTKYCPAQAMLGKIAPITLSYEIISE